MAAEGMDVPEESEVLEKVGVRAAIDGGGGVATGPVEGVGVPAKMTWLLQPVDTLACAAYKIHMQKAYQQACRHGREGSCQGTAQS